MRLLILLTTGLASGLLCVSCAKFAYERGKCDNSVLSVVQELVQNEMRALLNPALRYSQQKLLRYELYTPHNPNQRQILKVNDVANLKRSHFNAKWPVRFSIHGWTGKSGSCSNAAVKDAYLAKGNFNVIIVDWSAYSFDLSYGRVSKQLPAIAATLAKFIRYLHREMAMPYENVYLIGHSAGSHIAGMVGKLLRPERLGVIFALDPAGLTQRGAAEAYRLAPHDAIYVESIHTDTTLFGNPGVDLSQAAFFVNWGQGQRHCPNTTAAEFDISCDHFAALYYFAESVRAANSFGALRCRNANSIANFNCACNHAADDVINTDNNSDGDGDGNDDICATDTFMGGEPAVPKRGVYYLSTNRRMPYGLGASVQVRRPIKPTYLHIRPFSLY